jgi:hypothetical protein
LFLPLPKVGTNKPVFLVRDLEMEISRTQHLHRPRKDSREPKEVARDALKMQALSIPSGKQINAFAVDRNGHYVATGGYATIYSFIIRGKSSLLH